MTHKTKGTKEWAYKNLNIQKGCSNGCTYCYAKRMAKRFKRIESDEEWLEPEMVYEKLTKGYRKLDNPTDKFDYMFPTSHDITKNNLIDCITVLSKVLEAGNTVLITTKPDLDCIGAMCNYFKEFKEQIMFRFTITSALNETLRKYEPNAPNFDDRFEAVKLAFYSDYRTSLSIEPFLDRYPKWVCEFLALYVTDTIWIGIMSGKVPKELKINYSKENLAHIYNTCKSKPYKDKIRFKDSIVNKLGLEGNRV